MEIKVDQLSKDHPAVKAASMMVDAHQRHDTMNPAVEDVADEFPEMTSDQLRVMWIAVNAKAQQILPAGQR